MVRIIKSSPEDIDLVLTIRYETLMAVNQLECNEFDKEFCEKTKAYFDNNNQTTVLAMDGNRAVGCATLCYIELMPTYSHPTGKRGHIMNVYTKKNYRRQGIAKNMLELLLEEAKDKGVTHISLDATEEGRALYYTLGFTDTNEGMELII